MKNVSFFLTILLAGALLGFGDVQTPPSPGRPSEQTYRVRFLQAPGIQVDGRVDEPAWSRADVEKEFVFPWEKKIPPATEFRALCDDAHLYFSFRIADEDVVTLDKLRDEEDAVFEDRAEIYLSRDGQMKDYYCIEIDSLGRPFDYRGSFYRGMDPSWNLEGLEAKSSAWEKGYVVEGRVSLAGLEALGFPRLRPGVRVLCGLYRAEFSHDRSGRPVVQRASIHTQGRTLDGPPPLESWLSWVDPRTEEPDFHVPASLGWLEIVR